MRKKQDGVQSAHSHPNGPEVIGSKEQPYSLAKSEIVKVDLIDSNTMPTTLFIKTANNVDRLGAADVPEIVPVPQYKQQLAWKTFFHTFKLKVAIGLLIGIGLLFLVAHFVNVPAALSVLQKNLITPRGIILALFSGIAFLLAYTVRGIRWKLFLDPVGDVSISKTIRFFLIGVFINFLLPVQGGEVVKSVMLKRTTGIPMSKSLPTIAMDKSLDLMPALIIMAIVPFLGIHMDMKLWLVLGAVGALFISVIFFVVVAMWKRTLAIILLHKMIRKLPRVIGSKAEAFAIGFVDSLIMGVRRPKIFIPAVMLTSVAVVLDSLYIMLAFWATGFPIPFGTALFGYTVFNLFYIMPNPPGQVGSNEGVGLLIYTGLLHIPSDKVLALIVFAHPFSALLLCIAGITSLGSFGLNISSVMKVEMEDNAKPFFKEEIIEEEEQKVVL